MGQGTGRVGRWEGVRLAVGTVMILALAGLFMGARSWECVGGSCHYESLEAGLLTAQASYTSEPSFDVSIPSSGSEECSIQVGSGLSGAVRVELEPPPGAVVRSFSPDPVNDDGPPWVFDPVFAGSTITVTLGGTGDGDYCEWRILSDWNWERQRYDSRLLYSELVEGAQRSAGDRGTRPKDTVRAWFLWLQAKDRALTSVLGSSDCRRAVDILQSGEVVLALRYPVDPGLVVGAGWRWPIAFRGDDRPTLDLTVGSEVVAQSSLEDRPDWHAFAAANLPSAPGEDWAVLGVPPSPGITCPEEMDDQSWTVNLRMHLDFGGEIDAYREHVFEMYACYRGQSAPSLPGAAAAATESSVQAEGVTCYGPVPLRLVDWDNGPEPPYRVVATGSSSADPGGRAQIPFYLDNFGDDPLDLTVSFDSSLDLPWALYQGDYTAPDLGRPVSNPIHLDPHAHDQYWLSAEVPADARGLDTTRLSVVSGDHPVSWDTYFTLVGPFQAPPAGAGWTGWIPVGSRAPGAQGSQWRTDVGLLNPGLSALSAEIRLHGEGGTWTLPVNVPAHGEVIVPDAVGAVGYSGAGSLEVWAPGELVVTSRSYNEIAQGAECLPGGTLGQALDGRRSVDGLVAGQSATVPQLVENAAFRSNIGLVNMGSSSASVTVSLLDGSGNELGSYRVDLAPGEWKQENRPFATHGGRSDLDAAYAVVTVDEGAGVLAYGSVVDNITNDPTTVRMVPDLFSGVEEAWIPVAVHAPGANGSEWRTTVGLLNAGEGPADATLTLHTAGGTVTGTYTVGEGAQLVLDDVVAALGGDGAGPLEVSSTRPLLVTSRTYTRVAAGATCFGGGTLGQALEATTTAAALRAGSMGRIPHLVENAAFRSNLGLANVGTESAEVRIRLFDGGGNQLAVFDLSVGAGEWRQENRVFFNRAGSSELDAGWAEVEVLSGDGVLAYGSVVDNITNDPTTEELRRRW